MKAVILAAGIGKRLGKLTFDKPKCMLKINSKSLIYYQIELLKSLNIKEENIHIIGGHKIDRLKEHLKKLKINFVFNEKYKEWNNIYSFYLISKLKLENFILLNCDTYFHPEILKRVIESKKKNFVIIDDYKNLSDEEMKVIVNSEKIIKFGKDIPIEKAYGEYIGIAKFNKSYLKILFNEIEKLLRQGRYELWYEIAFNYITDKLDIFFINTENYPWIEIDNLEDYKKAKSMEFCNAF